MNQYAITYKNIRGNVYTESVTAASAEDAARITMQSWAVASIVSVTLIPAAWQVK